MLIDILRANQSFLTGWIVLFVLFIILHNVYVEGVGRCTIEFIFIDPVNPQDDVLVHCMKTNKLLWEYPKNLTLITEMFDLANLVNSVS